MTKIPSSRTLSPRNFPEAPGWLGLLLTPINTFFDAIYNALNGELTFVENIKSQINEIDFTTGAGYSGGTFATIKFLNELNKRATGVLLMRINKQSDNYESIQLGVHIDWQEIDGSIQIEFVSGLGDSTRYKMKVMVI